MTRLLPLLMLAFAMTASPWAQSAEPDEEASDAASVWDEVKRLYEAAKESGEQVPRDLYDWVVDDLESIGSWEYHVETVSGPDETLARRLNELGQERWELVGFRAVSAKAVRLVMKRPNRTYLNKIPLGDLLKLVPLPAEGGS